MSRADVLQLAPRLTAIISHGELAVDEELLDRAPRLRIVASVSSGVDQLDLELMARRGVYATNARAHFAAATADCTLGLMLALLRRLPEGDRFVRSGRWRKFQPGRWDGILLHGKTLGLVGNGSIGRAVAARARAFGMKVIFHQRTPVADSSYRPLHRLLAEADIVSLHVPLNADSRGLIDDRRLRQMKRGAWLINLSRGQVVDEAALIRALDSGRLGGAALDVFAREPHVPAALRRHANVVLTPHLGGGTRESRHQAWSACVGDVARVLSGRRPLNPRNVPAPKNLLAPSILSQ